MLILELSKSYRTTIEITENANSVLNHLNLEIANPVIRHGNEVLFLDASKGLEFDVVMINDASEKIYSSNSDLDMHLLYVASIRALHELIILYNKELTSVYKENNYSNSMNNEQKN